MSGAAGLGQLLEQLAVLDGQESGMGYLEQRELLIGEVARRCREDAEAAVVFLPGLQKLLERTKAIRQRTLEERVELSRTMSTLETHLRQLRSFGGPAAADATLLNRLA